MELTVKSPKLQAVMQVASHCWIREPLASTGFDRHPHRTHRAGDGDGRLREPAERRAAPGVAGGELHRCGRHRPGEDRRGQHAQDKPAAVGFSPAARRRPGLRCAHRAGAPRRAHARRAVLPDRPRRFGPAVPARAARRRRAWRARAHPGRRPVRGRAGRAAGCLCCAHERRSAHVQPAAGAQRRPGLARGVLDAPVLAHQRAHAQQAVHRRQRVLGDAVAATSPTNTSVAASRPTSSTWTS